MSLIACQCCTRILDSDEDPEVFVEVSVKESQVFKQCTATVVLCAACRELREKGMEEDNG